MFPCIVSKAKTVEVLVPGNRNGSLQLMYAELQVLSPLVPTQRKSKQKRKRTSLSSADEAAADPEAKRGKVNQDSASLGKDGEEVADVVSAKVQADGMPAVDSQRTAAQLGQASASQLSIQVADDGHAENFSWKAAEVDQKENEFSSCRAKTVLGNGTPLHDKPDAKDRSHLLGEGESDVKARDTKAEENRASNEDVKGMIIGNEPLDDSKSDKMAPVNELNKQIQIGQFTGAKKRKSGFVRRVKQGLDSQEHEPKQSEGKVVDNQQTGDQEKLSGTADVQGLEMQIDSIKKCSNIHKTAKKLGLQVNAKYSNHNRPSNNNMQMENGGYNDRVNPCSTAVPALTSSQNLAALALIPNAGPGPHKEAQKDK